MTGSATSGVSVVPECVSPAPAGLAVRGLLLLGKARQPGSAEQEQQGDRRNGDGEDGAHQAALAASASEVLRRGGVVMLRAQSSASPQRYSVRPEKRQ